MDQPRMYKVQMPYGNNEGAFQVWKLQDTMDYVVLDPNGKVVLKSIACDYATMKMMQLNSINQRP